MTIFMFFRSMNSHTLNTAFPHQKQRYALLWILFNENLWTMMPMCNAMKLLIFTENENIYTVSLSEILLLPNERHRLTKLSHGFLLQFLTQKSTQLPQIRILRCPSGVLTCWNRNWSCFLDFFSREKCTNFTYPLEYADDT